MNTLRTEPHTGPWHWALAFRGCGAWQAVSRWRATVAQGPRPWQEETRGSETTEGSLLHFWGLGDSFLQGGRLSGIAGWLPGREKCGPASGLAVGCRLCPTSLAA